MTWPHLFTVIIINGFVNTSSVTNYDWGNFFGFVWEGVPVDVRRPRSWQVESKNGGVRGSETAGRKGAKRMWGQKGSKWQSDSGKLTSPHVIQSHPSSQATTNASSCSPPGSDVWAWMVVASSLLTAMPLWFYQVPGGSYFYFFLLFS